LEASVLCRAPRADDVIGFALCPDCKLNRNAEARRGDLLSALPDIEPGSRSPRPATA
jgi:hypothetical protein